jgi:hypothetical protein
MVAVNMAWFGRPPILRAVGVPALTYSEYGRFKGVVYPAAMTLVLLSALEAGKWVGRVERAIYGAVGVGVLLAYIARGPLSIAIVQWGLVKVLYGGQLWVGMRRAVGLLGLTGVAFGLLGEVRSGEVYFAEAMQIRQEFRKWGAATLWLIGYVSFPAENLVALRRHYE